MNNVKLEGTISSLKDVEDPAKGHDELDFVFSSAAKEIEGRQYLIDLVSIKVSESQVISIPAKEVVKLGKIVESLIK